MAYLSSFDIAASGMSAQRLRMDIAAENIANIDTTRTERGGAYRRKDVVFESYGSGTFQEAMRNASQGRGINSRNVGVRVADIIEDDREMKIVYNPGHPDADEDGFVEMPNVDMVKEITDGMAASQAYSANVTVFNLLKTLISKGLEIGK